MSPVQLVQQLNQQASPLSEQQITDLQQLVSQLSPIQQAWVSGYLAASSQSASSLAPVNSAPVAQEQLTILVGSQTGNAKGIAQNLLAQCQQQGVNAKLVNMADFKVNQLKKETLITILVSTHGEGDAPDDAVTLFKYLHGNKAPKLDKLRYNVLALGDSSYEFFCKTGHDFDQQLQKLGAERIADIVECDVDFEETATAWVDNTITAFKPLLAETGSVSGQGQVVPFATTTSKYNRDNPFAAELLTNQKITSSFANKDVRHIELSLADSGIHYKPGDALGLWFDNDPALVEEVLQLTSIDPTTEVKWQEKTISVSKALLSHYELTLLHPGFVQELAQFSQQPELLSLIEDKANLRAYVAERQVIDVLREYPTELSAEQLLNSLRKLTPRLYSIASSQEEVDEEVHLTVAVVDYEAFGKDHLGGASGYLANRVEEQQTVNVYIENNDHFRLPANDDATVIMIGPGTGIAPFRAFLQQRDASAAQGKNWLFFGNQHFLGDFLYQSELLAYRNSGLLSQLDVAFSRDQEQKIYVQDKLKQQGAAIYDALQQGAYVYVCGDASRMAKDVHQALIEIIEQHGALTNEQATDYLDELRQQHRYQKDVY